MKKYTDVMLIYELCDVLDYEINVHLLKYILMIK